MGALAGVGAPTPGEVAGLGAGLGDGEPVGFGEGAGAAGDAPGVGAEEVGVADELGAAAGVALAGETVVVADAVADPAKLPAMTVPLVELNAGEAPGAGVL